MSYRPAAGSTVHFAGKASDGTVLNFHGVVTVLKPLIGGGYEGGCEVQIKAADTYFDAIPPDNLYLGICLYTVLSNGNFMAFTCYDTCCDWNKNVPLSGGIEGRLLLLNPVLSPYLQ